MNYNTVSKSVRRIADKTLTQDDLKHQVIIRKGNTYHAYNDYVIKETDEGWQVTAELDELVVYFTTAKVALAWCIAHKVRRFDLTRMMLHLDGLVSSKQCDVDLLTHRLKNQLPESCSRAVLMARLMEDINARQQYKKQLMNCVESAKYIKIKGTNHNELNRFSKTSRFRNSRRTN